MQDFGKQWIAVAIVIFFLLLLIGQQVDAAFYFIAFVGVPFATYYAFVAYEKMKKNKR